MGLEALLDETETAARLAAADWIFLPPAPQTIAETGLSSSLFEHLIFNILYSRGTMTGTLLDKFLEERYERVKKPLRRCHPRDLLLHVIDLIEFLRLPHELTEDLLNRAFDGCFAVAEPELE
jgi:hypothetical protein